MLLRRQERQDVALGGEEAPNTRVWVGRGPCMFLRVGLPPQSCTANSGYKGNEEHTHTHTHTHTHEGTDTKPGKKTQPRLTP